MTSVTPEHVDPFVGRLLDSKYRLLDRIAEGGMAVVYRAEHAFTKKIVAVKLLNPRMASEEIVKRFHREARIASAFDHPNVVLVMDFGHAQDEQGGFLYLVMEHLEGERLSDRIARTGGLSPPEAIDIVRQILNAMVQAQELGIVHRDLKPDNVLLLERDGRSDFVKILDFGIAKLLEPDNAEEAPLTQLGALFGTPDYMSPEQCRGDAADLRSDIYAVGIVLHEVLVGRRPFHGEDPLTTLRMHLTQAPPPLGKGLPSSLQKVVLRALEKRPEDRYQSAAQMLADLDRVSLAPEPWSEPGQTLSAPVEVERPADPPEPSIVIIRPEPEPSFVSAPVLAPPARRKKWPWVLLAVALLPVVLFAILLGLLAAHSGVQPALSFFSTLPTSSAARERARLGELLGSREVDRALQLARELAARSGDPARQRLALADDSLRHNRLAQALGELEEAVKLKPEFAAAPSLHKSLGRIALERALAPRALGLLAALRPPGGSGSARAGSIDEIRRIARASKDREVHRLATAKLLELAAAQGLVRTGLVADRDELVGQLSGGGPCKYRREVVKALKFLGDPQVLDALRQLRGGRIDRANACLVKDLDEAIAALEQAARAR